MTFVLYRDKTQQYRWALFAENNRQIAASGEGYHNKGDALAMITKMKQEAPTARVNDETTKP